MLIEITKLDSEPTTITFVEVEPPANVEVIPDFSNLESLSKQEVRDIISKVEAACTGAVQIEVPIYHHFSQDVYAREMRLKKGELIVGKIHKFSNLNILSGGEISVLSIDGVLKVKAPHTFVGSPGTKRVIYAHEDCVWTVIHGTAETDLEKIEETFIVKRYEELNLIKDNEVLLLTGE